MLGFRELYVIEYPKNSRGSWSVQICNKIQVSKAHSALSLSLISINWHLFRFKIINNKLSIINGCYPIGDLASLFSFSEWINFITGPSKEKAE